MKRLGVLTFVLLFSTSALAITIDGNNADWTTQYADPVGDHAGTADLIKWGAETGWESKTNYVYAYFEDPNMSQHMQPANDFFAALIIDLDRTGYVDRWGNLGPSGRTGWDGPSFLGADCDNLGNELSYNLVAGSIVPNTPIMGPDIWIEWGPNEEGWNYWGAQDDTWGQGSSAGNSAVECAQSGTFVEYKDEVANIKTEAATYPDAVTPKKVWKVAVRLAGFTSGGNWDGDKSGDDDNANIQALCPYQIYKYLPVETIMGDATEDGSVGINDLAALGNNWGKTVYLGNDGWAMGDFDASGVVGVNDLAIIGNNWGKTYSPPGGGAPVPEPTVLVLLGLGGLLLRRRS